jgi:TPR repeat protein
MFQYQVSLAADSATAAKHYSRACALESSVGCAALADFYRTGTGVAMDVAKALELYTRACRLGSGYGCTGAGKLITATQPTDGTAIGFYERAFARNSAECDEGDPYHCSLLGDAYREGLGVKKDFKRAFELYKYGCENGMRAGCDGLQALITELEK